MLSYGGRAWIACLLTFLIARVQVFLINAHAGVAATGVYSIALQIADAMLLVPGTIGMILMPRIAAAGAGDRAEITARVSRIAALAMTLLCAAAAIVAAPAIRLLYGPEFAGAIAPFLWTLPAVWATGLSGILMNHFAGDGLPPVVIGAPLAGLAVNVGLNLWLIPVLGLTGAAVAASVAALVLLALTLASFLRRGGLGLRQALVPAPRELAALLEVRP
jgi:O-antigen/teichoic acid export membrane protein